MAANVSGNSGKGFEQDAQGLARQKMALELRQAGLTYEAIAERTGFATAAGAYKSVKTAIRNAQRESGVEQLRDMELQRLDRLQAAVWPAALRGDAKALDRALKIMQQRANLLGLDRYPVKFEVTHREETKQDLELAEMVREGQARLAVEEQALRDGKPIPPPSVRPADVRTDPLDALAAEVASNGNGHKRMVDSLGETWTWIERG